MTKKRILVLIPLLIIAGLLVYSWAIILFTDVIAVWQHYIALLFFFVLAFLFFRNLERATFVVPVYLLIGTINLLTLTPSVRSNSYGIKIGSVEIATPSFQLLSFLIFVLFCILNFDALVNIYLDYQETRPKGK